MTPNNLMGAVPTTTASAPPDGRASRRRRLLEPDRLAEADFPTIWDDLVGPDDLVRLIDQTMHNLDLSPFLATVRVVAGEAGRAAITPAVLSGLWVYAVSQGVTSGRRLAVLCRRHLDSLWLCGGIHLSYHTLDDFRSQQAEAITALVRTVVAALERADLVTYETVSQDTVRVRTSAGSSSFHRRQTMAACLDAADAYLAHVPSPEEDAARAAVESRRKHAAVARAARERKVRLDAALAEMPAAEARVSTTDPEAQVQRMGDGGWRPGGGFDTAVDAKHGVIVAVEAFTGSDAGRAAPRVQAITAQAGHAPGAWLADGAFATLDDITTIEQQGTTMYAPPARREHRPRAPDAPPPTDSAAVQAWRVRMASDAGKEQYQRRGSTVEWTFAQERRHGRQQVPLRGTAKHQVYAYWMAITHNVVRALSLCRTWLAPAVRPALGAALAP